MNGWSEEECQDKVQMRVWDDSDRPALCPVLHVGTQGSSGRGLPWPWICRVSIVFQAGAAAPLPGKPPGCQQETAEVIIVSGMGSGGLRSGK